MKKIVRFLAAAVAATLIPIGASAQGWKPTKPITFVVAVAPGSSNDIVARVVSRKLAERLGQPVVVENRPGATGMVGASSVARATPDGHTIVIVPSSVYMTPILTPRAGGANFDILKDLTPIVTAGSAPYLLVANPSTNVRSSADFVAYLKKNETVSYGTAGTGSPAHIAGELLGRSTGHKMTHIPYKGVAPAITAVLANEVPFAIVVIAGSSQHIAAGKLNAVALTDRQRTALMPDLPTFAESGVRDVDSFLYLQILAPAGTPAPAIQTLNTEINAILSTAEIKNEMQNVGVQIIGGSAADAARRARETFRQNQQLVKDLNLTAE
jgi:tripartite-type tricarboxylate transporter receptor subunit TctC